MSFLRYHVNEVERLLSHLNSIGLSIQFSFERENEICLPFLVLNVHTTDRGNPETSQGRSKAFGMEGFLMYIACPIDNRVPEALFTRGVRGHASSENFLILGLQKWSFLDFGHKFPITSALNVVSTSKGIVNIASWIDGP